MINSIFDWIGKKFDISGDANGIRFNTWIQHTSEIAFKLCGNFTTENVGDALHEDYLGLLPLALALRSYQTIDQTKETSVRFFAHFSRLAAETCIKDVVENVESKVQMKVKEMLDEKESKTVDKLDSLRFSSVATSEVVLELVIQAGEKITRDGPRFLGAVDMVANCEQIGMMLFRLHANEVKSSVGIYESKEESGIMCDHFERLESLSNDLKKRVMAVIVDKNMMRTKELLATMCGFYGDCKTMAESLSNRTRESTPSSRRQSNMDMFLQESTPIDESQDLDESQFHEKSLNE